MNKTLLGFLSSLVFTLLFFASVFMDVHYKGMPLGLSLAYHCAVIGVILGMFCLAVFVPRYRAKRRVSRHLDNVLGESQ